MAYGPEDIDDSRELIDEVFDDLGVNWSHHYEKGVNRGFMSRAAQNARDEVIEDYVCDELEDVCIYNDILDNGINLEELGDAIRTVHGGTNILMAIDIEAWEHDQRMITEIGISIYDPTLQRKRMRRPYVQSVHVIIDEYEEYRNGDYVEDNKYNFTGGVSYVMSHREAMWFVQTLINYYFFLAPHATGHRIGCVLVGHALQGDIKWLRNNGIWFPENMSRLDTQQIWSYTKGLRGSSLQKILKFMRMPNLYLHNAGNDAYYTLLLCLEMCDPDSRRLNNLDTEVAEYNIVAFDPNSIRGAQQSRKVRVPGHKYVDVEEALNATFGRVKFYV